MFIVELYTSPSGKEIVREFLDQMAPNQRSKILKAIVNLREFGISREIPNLRKISATHLWEYRILGRDNIRIICVTKIGKRIVVLNIFIKKKQKTPVKELKISLERYKIDIDR